MIVFPPCKINLGLHITRKRPDGYHDIETCLYPVPWTDVLEVIPSDSLAFTSSGLPIPGERESNLCLKAYQLLQRDFNLTPVKIHLHKIISIGAGLGGGSSDAAHTVLLLNSIFKLNLPNEKLNHYASLLGSDCSFFLQDTPMIGIERGDTLSPVDVKLKNKFLLIVNPEIHVSTAEAYSLVTPAQPMGSIRKIMEQVPVQQWRDHLVNDFESSLFKKYTVIKDIKNKLYALGALYASMSGSGSSVFGIFDKELDSLPPTLSKYAAWRGIL